MIGVLPVSSAVLSAFMGAIALRTVERVESKRSAITAIHHDLLLNYYRLQGEIEDIRKDEWSEQYTRVVRIDGIESVKAQNPEFYRTVIEDVDNFVAALAALENIRYEQMNSRQPGAYVEESSEEVREKLTEVQEEIAVAEENLREYRSKRLYRKLILWRTIESVSFDPVKNTRR